MRQQRLLAGSAFALLSLLLAGTLWVVPYLPTNDGPEWVFASHLENHYGDPGTIYRDVLVPTSQFASRGFTPILSLFDGWLGWERGLQVALTVTVLLSAWGFAALVCAIDTRRWPLGLLGFPLALSWPLYMGLWAFVVSTAVGLFVIALAVRLRTPTWKGRLLLSLALLMNAFAHVFGAVLTGGVVLVLGVARAPRSRRLGEVGRVALTGLPAAAVLAACVAVALGQPVSPLAHGVERLPWRDAAAILPRTIAPGPLARALPVTLAVAFAAGLALARARRPVTDSADRGLGIAAVLLLLLAVFTPFQVPGWQAFSQRFVPMGVALALAVLPLEHLSRSRPRAVVAVLSAVAALWVVPSYPFHRRLAGLCPDAIAGLSAPVPLTGVMLPVTLRTTELSVYDRIDAEVPLMAPLRHMGTLYAAAHGGISLPMFANNPAIDPFVARPTSPMSSPRPLPDAEHYFRAIASPRFHHDLPFRREVDGELASFGVFYDETAVFGALPEDLEVWRERGYVADWTRGTTLLAHFEPCTIDFTVSAAASDPAPTFDLRVGTFSFVSGARARPVLQADDLAHFDLTPAPCGVVTVHPRWEPSADGRALTCANADADGNLVAHVSHAAHRVVCEVR